MTFKELKSVIGIATQVEVYTLPSPGNPQTLYAGAIRFSPYEIDEYVVVHFHITNGALEIKVSDKNNSDDCSSYSDDVADFFRSATTLCTSGSYPRPQF